MPCCRKVPTGAAAKASAASRAATAAATKAARQAAAACPPGGCHGKRAAFVSPKKPQPTKVKPCDCKNPS